MFISTTIKNFFVASNIDFEKIEPLRGDASTREYSRVFAGNETYVLCLDQAARGTALNDYPFYLMYKQLKRHGLPVPEIYAMDMDAGLMLLEDLGDDPVECLVSWQDVPHIESVYRQILDIMLRIQMIDGDSSVLPFSLAFDAEKLMFEFDFFIRHALCGYFGLSESHPDIGHLRREFGMIAQLLDQPRLFVLNHRDFHSRNIMWHRDRPYIIDFQDARMGLPQYDLVSLLRDSYLRLPDDVSDRLVDYYFVRLADAGYTRMDRDRFDYYFDLMGFQRNVKAIGTFGYQVTARGNERYAQSIPRTLAYLDAYCSRRSELRPAFEIIGRHIRTAP